MSVRHLVVVQDRETQFDAPLYAKIFAEKPFALTVFYTSQSGSQALHDSEIGRAPFWDHLAGISYFRSSISLDNPLCLLRFAADLRRLSPDLVVICGYFPRTHLVLAIVLKLMALRIGLRSDNTLQHSQFRGPIGRMRRFCIGWIQRLYDCWHPVGRLSQAYLKTIAGVERPTFRFAYAVDNDWFRAEAMKARLTRSAFLSKLGWPLDSYVILSIIKWNQREDPFTLIEAFHHLSFHQPRIRLILVGDGPLRDSVHEACAGSRGLVHLPGYQPYTQLPSWYGRADLFVHPAPNEPWGVSINEALACGLPVVAADGVGAAHELIDPGVNGFVFQSCNVRSLALSIEDAISAFQADPDRTETNCLEAANAWHYRNTVDALSLALGC